MRWPRIWSLLGAETRSKRRLLLVVSVYVCLMGLVWLAQVPLRPSYKTQIHNKLTDALQQQLKKPDRRPEKQFEALLADPKETGQQPEKVLTVIFKRVDGDQDNLISLVELVTWINSKIQHHISQSLRENFVIFTMVDSNPRNGLISWEEYHHYFLKKHGLNETYIKNHDKKHRGLVRSIKETIMKEKRAWSEAARSDPSYLNVDEFLAFRHPESSHSTIVQLVEELLDKFDRDGDDTLTETEYASLRAEGDLEHEAEELRQGEGERRAEFRTLIDKNHDGRADRNELLVYIDPRNPRHARDEAETLVMLADTNKDGFLSLPEILNKMDLFLSSKMVNAAKSFHDDF
ncbi:45 kDa calcium-binding protein [Neocloeon triangulifer]|uniref:45 kDa calcium-binding protein n=1 Tax=Neocloeon triangulifer TaxID=2078957 RepID=UPI00286EFA41|nr:45 kDa calcium-binding protein [Neocloeon triangulifer]